MAKKNKSFMTKLLALIVAVLGVLVAVNIFIPYLGQSTSVLGSTAKTVTINGLEFIKCLFESNSLESIVSGDGNALIKIMMGVEELSPAVYTLEIAAIGSAISGALLALTALLFMFSRSKGLRSAMMFFGFFAFAFGLAGIISGAVICNKLTVDAGIAASKIFLSAGTIIALAGGIVATTLTAFTKAK